MSELADAGAEHAMALVKPRRRGAGFNRGQSRQDYQTPPEFLAAVKSQFGTIGWDLAAHAGNHVVPDYYGPGGAVEDSLSVNWNMLTTVRTEHGHPIGLGWCNPPYDNIKRWVKKAAESRLTHLVMLVPTSTGVYFREYVHNIADVYFLTPRLTFVGEKDPYPKDLMLLHYYPEPWRIRAQRHFCWDWKRGIVS